MSMICTSIEQSQKLVELGIGINTADMCWQNNEFPIGFNDDDAVPAWSLSALLELMPITCILSITNGHYRISSNERNTLFHNNPLDAAFEMIVWLKENKKI